MNAPRLRRAAAAALVAGVVAGPAVVPGAAPSAAAAAPSVASARAEAAALRAQVDELSRRLAETATAYEKARSDLGTATAQHVQVQRHLEDAESARVREQAALRSRIRGIYATGGGLTLMAGVFAGRDPADLVGRAALVQDVLTADREAMRSSEQARQAAAEARAEAETAARRQVAVSAAADGEAARLEGLLVEQRRLLESADAEVRRLVEEEAARERQRVAERAAAEAARAARAAESGSARARAIPSVDLPGGTGQLPGSAYGGSSADRGRSYRPGSTAGMACPVGTVHSFTDTWLAPRSGGRRHQGTDVFAPYGSTAYAVVDGVVDKVGNGGLGGITLWIRSDSGDRFYYAHNAANLVGVGDRVSAGQPVAKVGKTGNAATTPPHVHFEAHPAGGAAANPYPVLKTLCG